MSDTVTMDEIVLSNMLQLEALTRVLVRRGLLEEQEMLDEIQEVRRGMMQRRAGIVSSSSGGEN